jgi:hypothetical protein
MSRTLTIEESKLKKFGRVLSVQSVFAAIFLAACTLPFVDRYDADLEAGVNKYQKDVTKFVKDAELGGKSRRFGSTEAKAFYSTASADLSNAIIRAQAISTSGTCPTTQAVNGMLEAIANDMDRAIGAYRIRDSKIHKTLQDIRNLLNTSEFASGSCTVVVMRALKANQDILELIHKTEGDLRPPASTLALQIIDDTARIAVATAVANKPPAR